MWEGGGRGNRTNATYCGYGNAAKWRSTRVSTSELPTKMTNNCVTTSHIVNGPDFTLGNGMVDITHALKLGMRKKRWEIHCTIEQKHKCANEMTTPKKVTDWRSNTNNQHTDNKPTTWITNLTPTNDTTTWNKKHNCERTMWKSSKQNTRTICNRYGKPT